jgi:HK97 family phage prohead protease
MALKISSKSISQAKSLIKAGKINMTGSWGFDSSDRNALLKSVNNDWSKYAAWFLVYDDEAKKDTFQRYKYPYGKQGKVWRRGVIAIKTRAAQNNWSELANIADNLLQMIDEKEEKGFSQDSEYRVFPVQELRVEDDEKEPVIRGYAAVFDVWSVDLGGFREIIKKGAFKKTIKDGADVRALFNHDRNIILGRTSNETLKLEEDEKGLAIEIKPPDTNLVNDMVIAPIKRKDITQMSFAFKTIHDKWGKNENMKPPIYRELIEAKLYDISPVTFPAYPQTTVDIRAILEDSGIDYRALAGIILCEKYGLEITEEDKRILERSIEILNRCLPAEPEQELHSAEIDEDEVQEYFVSIDERTDKAVKEIL